MRGFDRVAYVFDIRECWHTFPCISAKKLAVSRQTIREPEDAGEVLRVPRDQFVEVVLKVIYDDHNPELPCSIQESNESILDVRGEERVLDLDDGDRVNGMCPAKGRQISENPRHLTFPTPERTRSLTGKSRSGATTRLTSLGCRRPLLPPLY